MKTSNAGIEFIAQQEGFSNKAYKDGFIGSVQKYSIGFGHQIQSHEGDLRTRTITRNEGLKLLANDIKTVENVLNKNGVFSQHEFDALCSFGFNCGVGALAKVLQTYRTKTKQDTVNHFSQYIYWTVNGVKKINQTLVKRRKLESEIFLKKKVVVCSYS